MHSFLHFVLLFIGTVHGALIDAAHTEPMSPLHSALTHDGHDESWATGVPGETPTQTAYDDSAILSTFTELAQVPDEESSDIIYSEHTQPQAEQVTDQDEPNGSHHQLISTSHANYDQSAARNAASNAHPQATINNPSFQNTQSQRPDINQISDNKQTQLIITISCLSVAWIFTASNALLTVKTLVSLSKVIAFWTPLISLLLWGQLLVGCLLWSKDIDNNSARVAVSVMHSLFLGYCCMMMLVLFNRRWKEWKFRNAIVRSRSVHGKYPNWIIPLSVRIFIGISFAVAVYSAIASDSVHVSVPLIFSGAPTLIFLSSELVLSFRNRSLTPDEKWKKIINQEISKSKTQWFLIRYILWFTVIPLLVFQWISTLQAVEASVLNIIFMVHAATRMVMDIVVFTMIHCKQRKRVKKVQSQRGSLCTFPVHSKAALGGHSTPICEGDIYCEAYFHEMINDHVDDTGCVPAAVLKQYAFKVLARDLETGALDETTLYQLLDTMVTMQCSQIFYLLRGLMKPTNDKAVIEMETKTPRRRQRGRVPMLNANDLSLARTKSSDVAFAAIPQRRRTSYLKRTSQNTCVRLPTPVSEGNSEWIYDWMSVSSEHIFDLSAW